MYGLTLLRPFGQRLEGGLLLPQHGIQVVEVQALGESALCAHCADISGFALDLAQRWRFWMLASLI